MHRLTGDLINEIPSMCDHHTVRLNKYPKEQHYAFEGCLTCKEIYAHNINTGESFSVYRGFKIERMCEGPDGSLLVMDTDWELYRLDWHKRQDRAQLVFLQLIPERTGKGLLKLCYIESHDILICTIKDFKDDTDYEIMAMRLGSEAIVWRMYGAVDGHVVKPEFITCDTDGNAYVNDRVINRILKINSLTGEILSF